MDERTYKLIGAAYAELETKEQWCEGSENIADIAVLSVDANRAAFGNLTHISGSASDVGVSRLLLEGKYLYDIVDSEADINKYKLLILPDCITANNKLAKKIKAFIKNGGYILASGNINIDLGVDITGDSGYFPSYALGSAINGNESPAVVYAKAWQFKPNKDESGYKTLANRINPYFNRDMLHFSSHQHTPYNIDSSDYGIVRHDNIIYCGWEIFSEYADHGSITTKELVFMMIENLIGDTKTIETNLGAQGIITLRKQESENRYILHKLYASPVKRGQGIEIIEDILPVYNTSVKVRIKSKPENVYSVPQNERMDWYYNDGVLYYTLKKFHCHQMIVIEM
jgi:hypothetical protein